jgi:hypothetical protein
MAFNEALAERVRSVLGRRQGTTERKKSMVYLTLDGTKDDKALEEWVRRAVAYASSLPATRKE